MNNPMKKSDYTKMFKQSEILGNGVPAQEVNGGGGSGSSTVSVLGKLVPLIFAGAALGVSVIVLKELKNTRKEIIQLKKGSFNSVNDTINSELIQKVTDMDQQLIKISEYLAHNQQNRTKDSTKKSSLEKKGKVINKIINEEIKKEPEVVENIAPPTNENGEEVEYIYEEESD